MSPAARSLLAGHVTSAFTTLKLSANRLHAAFCSASAQSLASISTAVISMPGTRAPRQITATPTPAPASSTRSPARAGTGAARNTASLPARCPARGCSTLMRPPRKSSALIALSPRAPLGLLVACDDMADAGLGEDFTRLVEPRAIHQHAPRQR